MPNSIAAVAVRQMLITAHGDINKPYETGCELQRKRVECAIMLKAAEAYDEGN